MYNALGWDSGVVGVCGLLRREVKGDGSGRHTRPPITLGAALELGSEGSDHSSTRLKAPEERGSERRA